MGNRKSAKAIIALRAFKVVRESTKKTRYTCNFCSSSYSNNITRVLQHYEGCSKRKEKDTERQERLAYQPSLAFKVSKYTDDEKKALNRHWAKAIYCSGLPFATFEGEHWDPVWQSLSYKPPHRNTLSSTLLDEVYTETSTAIRSRIMQARGLTVIMDGSKAISHERIESICILTPDHLSYFVKSVVPPSDSSTSEALERLLLDALTTEFGGEILERVIAFTSDTENKMTALWKLLAKRQETSHWICTGCDSHGLQLLIKDLIQLPSFTPIFKDANYIVNYFRNSPKQYAILRKLMRKFNEKGKVKALIAACDTRWGSQLVVILCIMENRLALQTFHIQHGKEVKDSRLAPLSDETFWVNLQAIRSIIQPIHELQKASEANAATLGYVVERWRQITGILEEAQGQFPQFSYDLSRYCSFDQPVSRRGVEHMYQRTARQLESVHWLAYFLRFDTLDETPHESLHTELLNLFRKRFGDDAGLDCWAEFMEFRNRSGIFALDRLVWQLQDRVTAFWQTARQHAPRLAEFALDLIAITANSVAAERAFSSLNFIFDKRRSRLDPERVDKLQSIYINERTLRLGPVYSLLDVDDELIEEREQAMSVEAYESALSRQKGHTIDISAQKQICI